MVCSFRPDAAKLIVHLCQIGPTAIDPKSPSKDGGNVNVNVNVNVNGDGDGDGDSLGVPACDLLGAFFRCYAKKLPGSSGNAILKAWHTSLKAYRRSLSNPATRAAIVKSCKMALEALRKNIGKMPQYKDCVQ